MAVKKISYVPYHYEGLSTDTTAWLATNTSEPDTSTYTEVDGLQRTFKISNGTWTEQSKVNKSRPWTFHDSVLNANTPAGNAYDNTDDRDVVTFGIGGTSTSQVYEFRAIDAAGNDNLVTCYRKTDSHGAMGTTVKGETWEADISRSVTFYVKLVSISGGTGIVKGLIK